MSLSGYWTHNKVFDEMPERNRAIDEHFATISKNLTGS